MSKINKETLSMVESAVDIEPNLQRLLKRSSESLLSYKKAREYRRLQFKKNRKIPERIQAWGEFIKGWSNQKNYKQKKITVGTLMQKKDMESRLTTLAHNCYTNGWYEEAVVIIEFLTNSDAHPDQILALVPEGLDVDLPGLSTLRGTLSNRFDVWLLKYNAYSQLRQFDDARIAFRELWKEYQRDSDNANARFIPKDTDILKWKKSFLIWFYITASKACA